MNKREKKDFYMEMYGGMPLPRHYKMPEFKCPACEAEARVYNPALVRTHALIRAHLKQRAFAMNYGTEVLPGVFEIKDFFALADEAENIPVIRLPKSRAGGVSEPFPLEMGGTHE